MPTRCAPVSFEWITPSSKYSPSPYSSEDALELKWHIPGKAVYKPRTVSIDLQHPFQAEYVTLVTNLSGSATSWVWNMSRRHEERGNGFELRTSTQYQLWVYDAEFGREGKVALGHVSPGKTAYFGIYHDRMLTVGGQCSFNDVEGVALTQRVHLEKFIESSGAILDVSITSLSIFALSLHLI
jgi:hypothetical protein